MKLTKNTSNKESRTTVEFITIEYNGSSADIISAGVFEQESKSAVTNHLSLLTAKIQSNGRIDYELNSSSTSIANLLVNGRKYRKVQCWIGEGFPTDFSGQPVPVLNLNVRGKTIKWICWN
jgi:hypothetical protein